MNYSSRGSNLFVELGVVIGVDTDGIKLGLKTVAEGIETRADWNLLKDIGCTIGQGHFMAKALAADAFIDWVPEWAPPERVRRVASRVFPPE